MSYNCYSMACVCDLFWCVFNVLVYVCVCVCVCWLYVYKCFEVFLYALICLYAYLLTELCLMTWLYWLLLFCIFHANPTMVKILCILSRDCSALLIYYINCSTCTGSLVISLLNNWKKNQIGFAIATWKWCNGYYSIFIH